MKPITHPAILFLVISVSSTSTCRAQGTKADYDRANGLARFVQGKVLNASIEPHWIDKGNRFWYRKDLPAGRREFILVDAGAASKLPAFDHKRLSESLAKSLGKP